MVSWAIQSSTDKEFIFEAALAMGWMEDKVQVKHYKGMEDWYVIEPYEENCMCPDLVPRPAHVWRKA